MVMVPRENLELLRKLMDSNASRLLLDSIPDLIFEFDGAGRCLNGARPHQAVLEIVNRVRDEKEAAIVEYSMAQPDGVQWFQARVFPLSDGGVAACVRDHTSRKRTETRLEESERRFRAMADAAPVLLWMAGLDGECNFFNKTWLEFSGRPLERELGVGWADGIHFEDFQGCMDAYLSAFVDRRGFRIQYRLRRADGAYRWILDHGVPRFDADGSFAGFIGSCIDITELKDLQLELDARVRDRTERLAAALAERETLIKEVHHRVKNNLQVISSLINMQARHLEGRDPLTVLEESQGRIFSIALVHERLYRSKDLARVEFGEYVKSLTESVMQTFGVDDGRIEVAYDLEAIDLSVHLAIPCGLIIHELLTNAFKYAFPGDRRGKVRIGLARSAEHATLVIADDGVGLPQDLEPGRGSSLGLFLVTTLVEQLEAELEVERRSGTSFRIRFRG